MQPICGTEALSPSGCFSAALACALVMSPSCAIRPSTVFRRLVASFGLISGLYRAGFSTRPASIADCASVRWAASVLKYRCAATWMPYAELPKNAAFR